MSPNESPPASLELPSLLPDATDGGKQTNAVPLDKALYNAWKEHMIGGYKQNSLMFKQVLDAFMKPYWISVRMYQLMFVVGILGFLAAVVLGIWQGYELAAVFGGLTTVSFLAFFISKPLVSLEQNLQFITWLGLIYNTYWTRLMYASDATTVQADLEAITATAIGEIQELVNKHAELSGKRPGAEE
jgi:hypothetical protein